MPESLSHLLRDGNRSHFTNVCIRNFDAGDHKTLVHMSGREFDRLMHDSPHGRFSRHY